MDARSVLCLTEQSFNGLHDDYLYHVVLERNILEDPRLLGAELSHVVL